MFLLGKVSRCKALLCGAESWPDVNPLRRSAACPERPREPHAWSPRLCGAIARRVGRLQPGAVMVNSGVVRSHGSVSLSVKNVWTSICRSSRTNGLHTCHWRDRQVVVTVGVLGSTVFPPVVCHLQSRCICEAGIPSLSPRNGNVLHSIA